MALGVAVVVAAGAVVVPLTVVDRSVSGTPVAADEPDEPAPPPERECADGELVASGSSLARNAVDEVSANLANTCPGTVVDYAPTGSGAGLDEFMSGATAMAVVDRPLTESEYGNLSARCAAEAFPFVAHPVTVRYNVGGDVLTLDAPALAKIFSGEVTTWHDAAIAELNPGVALPAKPITVVGRGDESSTTAAFQQYLAEAGDWTGGTGTTFTGRAARSAQGDSGVLTLIESTDGAIGYVTIAEGTRSQTALLDGVAPSPDTVAATIAAALPDDRLTLDPADVYGTEADGAYPLMIVSYALTCADEPVARDFLLTSLSMAGSGHVFPSGEWADRMRAALQ